MGQVIAFYGLSASGQHKTTQNDRARDLLGDVGGISARDAIHAAGMMNHGIKENATFDQGFDRVAGVDRVDLS